MSLNVALQSVAFYVLSCSTCAKISHRRKVKQQTKRERAEKQTLEMEQPGLYRHPSPFSTNPYWTEEIMLGPGPPPKKGGSKAGSKTGSTRALNTGGMGSSIGSRGDSSTAAGSSPTMVETNPQISGEGWNIKRYQREDEELWGHEPDKQHTGQRFVDAIVRASTVVTSSRLLNRNKDIEEDEDEDTGSYYITRNPPVNDLHPPVVSTHTHKDATQWMLQPPPPAKVMEGKERAIRSRSDSGASSRRGGDGPSLSRQVSSRLMEAKLARGESPSSDLAFRSYTPNKSRTNTSNGRLTPSSARPTTHSSSSESSDAGVGSRRKRRPPPIFTSSSTESLSNDRIVHNPIKDKNGGSLRPGLNTIPSSSMEVPKAKGKKQRRRDLDVTRDEDLDIDGVKSPIGQREDSPTRLDTSLLTPSKNAMPVTLRSMDSPTRTKGDSKENVGLGASPEKRKEERWSMDL